MMYQANLYPHPEMGCGGSKAVATVGAGSTSSINCHSARRVSTSSHSARKENEHPEIAVFGLNDVDIPIDPVDNAKPRLLHSAIGRGSNQNHGPITPVLGNQEELLLKRVSNNIDSTQKSKDIEIFRLEDEIPSDSVDICKSKSQRSGIRRGSNQNNGHVDGHQEFLLRTSTTNTESVSLPGESNALKTTNNHNISPNFPRLQIGENKDDLLSCNVSRTNLSGSRASSAKAGSILTTTALNTSIVTSLDGEDLHSELASGTPHTSMTDYECSAFRTMSITPSVHASVDATPVALHDRSFGPIVEEYEGGFTPRSIHNGDAKEFLDPTRKFTPREVFQHNLYVGWNEWSIYKGKIYDNGSLKETFTPLIQTAREKRAAEKLEYKMQKEAEKSQRVQANGDSDYDDSYSDYSNYSDSAFCNEDDLTSLWTWNTNGVRLVLMNGLEKETVEEHLASSCVGTIIGPTDKRYWDDVRNDIKFLLDDLNREDAKDALSIYVAEYLRLLQRWIKKYRDLCPDNSGIPEGDPNEINFPLPEGIDQNPESLRAWIEKWECFDLDMPENGAWTVIEVEDIDLGDPHDIFAATLKSHINLTPLDTAVDGEAGWRVIQEGLFADDVMTEEQKITEEGRKERRDLFDKARMKRRRQRILRYFIDKYDYSISDVEHHLIWADEMEKGERKFLSLC